jgi:predicted component of type VI protein secretion system
VIDEPVGSGRVILSATDPNFRAWTVGMQKVLRNAVLGPDAFADVAARAGSAARASKERAARSAAASIAALESPLRISVPATSARTVRALLGRYHATYTVRQAGSTATFLVANPGGLTGDDHPFAAALAGDLAAAAVPVVAFKAP